MVAQRYTFAYSMGANATLDFGPVQVELRAENADELEEELEQIIGYLESNNDRINSIFAVDESPSMDSSQHDVNGSEDGGHSDDVHIDAKLSDIADKLRVRGANLNKLILTDDDFPQLYLDELDLLAERKTERQRRASLILLYLWDEYYGVDRVKTSELKTALSRSGISESNLANMYQGQGDRFFDRTGRGASATIGLTAPGRRRAQKALSELVESWESRSESEQSEISQP